MFAVVAGQLHHVIVVPIVEIRQGDMVDGQRVTGLVLGAQIVECVEQFELLVGGPGEHRVLERLTIARVSTNGRCS